MTTSNYDFTTLFAKLSRMPKAKALAVITTEFPGYEATDVYTVRDNLTAAIEAAENALRLQAEAESPKSTDDRITDLLDALTTAATKNEKKAIRAKLRRLNYRLSDNHE